MQGVLESVDQRTQLAGENRLELLLFNLEDKQTFGLNVFKIREIIRTPKITAIPKSHPTVKGVVSIRGTTIAIIDLSLSIGLAPNSNPDESFIIITEFNQTTQGFMVSKVNRIINTSWDAITPPPPGVAFESFLTAVTKVDDSLVQIIDVEKILAEITPPVKEVSEEAKQKAKEKNIVNKKVLICDDSSVARRQMRKTLEDLGMEVVAQNNGQEALTYLEKLVEDGKNLKDEILLLISDVEMPVMDGYKLTTEIRKNEKLKDLHVVLHTSLSGVFNNALIKKVGADQFIPKFDSALITKAVLGHDNVDQEAQEKDFPEQDS